MSQDYLELGLDVTSFTDAKLTKLNEFVAVFDKLSLYDGKTINPIMGSGLVQFNESVKTTSSLLTELNTKLAALSANSKNVSTSTAAASRGVKKMTEEEAKLKFETQEYNKTLMENVKAQSATAQARKTRNASIKNTQSLLKAEYDMETQISSQQETDSKKILALKKQEDAANKKLDANKKKSDADKKRSDKEAEAQSKKTKKATDDEAKAVKALASQLDKLRQIRKDQANAYAKAVVDKGSSSKEARLSLGEYEKTNKTITDIESKLKSSANAGKLFSTNLTEAGNSAETLGRNLTKGLSVLRNLAYILPGIGLAGIFNLAYEAIYKAFTALVDFKGGTEDVIRREIELNQILSETRDLLKEIGKEQSRAYQTAGKKNVFVPEEEELNRLKSFGESINEVYQQEIKLSDLQTKLAENKLIVGSPEETKKRIDQQKKGLDELLRQYGKVQQVLLEGDFKGYNYADVQSRQLIKGKELIEKKKESLEGQISFEQKKLSELNDSYEDYYANIRKNEQLKYEYQKLLADQARNLVVETTKSTIELNKQQNQIIFDDEISSYEDRAKALKDIMTQTLKENANSLYDVIKNNSSTPDEIAIAQFKFDPKKGTENLKAINEYNDKLIRLNEEYKQRLLTAVEKVDEDRINAEAVHNERIFKNEEKSLEERLAAYEKYILLRQQIQDIQFIRERNTRTLQAKGNVPESEILALLSNRDTQKLNAQADAEKQIYEIVSQSLDAQLKYLKDINQEETRENLNQYTEELKNLNESYENKLISYERYKEERKRIDKKYEVKVLDETIVDDEKDLNRLLKNRDSLLKKRKTAEENLGRKGFEASVASRGTDVGRRIAGQRGRDEAVGELNAINDAIIKNDKEIENVEKRRDENKNKREKRDFDETVANKDKELEKRRQYIQMFAAIEESIYKVVKDSIDKEYQYRVDKLNAEKALIDERYDYEIAAVQRSSLSAKDKFALDIQLNARRLEADKKAAREEKKLAHDKAIYDKALAISHITLSTAAAVAEALPVVPLAIAAGVAGAAELAIAANVRIPTYKTGVKGKPSSGWAVTGEAGPELIKQPYKSPYLVYKENVSWLPKGTDVIPLKENDGMLSPIRDDGWEKTRWLAKQLRPKDKKVNVVNNITIDLGFENYKKSIIGN